MDRRRRVPVAAARVLSRGAADLRAAALTTMLVGAGSALGYVRDLLMAALFGANADTDAFLIAWTVPETAAPLLIEGAMALWLVPLFSTASGARQRAALVQRTLPALAAALAAVAVCAAAGAPWLVAALAPGLPQGGLAVQCWRICCGCILPFALAGYASAALRAHHVFGPPAATGLAYNLALVGCLAIWHDALGVRAAAWGVAAGAVLMVATQAPAYLRRVGLPRRLPRRLVLPVAALLPIIAFTLLRQGQVLVERVLAADLPAGAISHLNYAQKIAQVPMVVSLMLATVTYPHLARSIAAGDTHQAWRLLARDLAAAAAVTVAAAALLVAFAPTIVGVLLHRGAFDDAAATATEHVLRLYAIGLLGHTVVGVVCRAYFCAGGWRGLWYPALSMAAGLALTATLAAALVPGMAQGGIALANAAGITVTAALMLAGLPRLGLSPLRRAVTTVREGERV
ncbi:lipid II flippase MurJ [Nonomuraea sp. NPDC001636]|uniref:lipid II flippase MurJ n=1 Tax=Nonomuraea sp. NPDC001636 TaxID=3154391 RepID=UPI00332F1D29